MLIICLIMNVVVFEIDKHVEPEDLDNDDGISYWSYVMAGNTFALWTILVTSIAIAIELILAVVNIIALKYRTVCNFQTIFRALVRETNLHAECHAHVFNFCRILSGTVHWL